MGPTFDNRLRTPEGYPVHREDLSRFLGSLSAHVQIVSRTYTMFFSITQFASKLIACKSLIFTAGKLVHLYGARRTSFRKQDTGRPSEPATPSL